MSDPPRPRRRRSSKLRRFLRAWKWWAPVPGLLAVLAGVGFYLAQDVSQYSVPRMSGPPIVAGRGEHGMVIFTTTHQEIRSTRWRRLLGQEPDPPLLHWDVWGFDTRELRQRWVTRVASVRRGQHDPGRGVLGAEGGGVWILANRLVLVSQNGGRVMGDAPMIEARNRELRARFPTARQAFSFDRGLVITAANGNRLRVDPRGLTARSEENAARATDSILPMVLAGGGQAARQRGITLERTWFGLLTAAEQKDGLSLGQLPDPNYNLKRSYRLVTGRVAEALDADGASVRRLEEMAVLTPTTEFIDGGILRLEVQPGTMGPVLVASPPRLMILHREPAGGAEQLALTMIGLGGAVQWRSPLQLAEILGGVPLSEGIPATWAALVAAHSGTARTPRDAVDVIARIGLQEGRMLRIDISALPVAGLRLTSEE